MDDGVFKALADPTRRALLDALFATDGQTLSSLTARHPQLTRFGVMKHLRILEDAGLVVAQRVGREKRHFLADFWNHGTVVDGCLSGGGHGRGGRLGEGEPEGHPERDGRTQPNFGQHGTYASTEEKPEPDRDDG